MVQQEIMPTAKGRALPEVLSKRDFNHDSVSKPSNNFLSLFSSRSHCHINHEPMATIPPMRTNSSSAKPLCHACSMSVILLIIGGSNEIRVSW